ncbi:MAG: hypothetical protein H6Q89_5482 [Myxococcaceae bacterium]|nr:hypothetical protein [Myxococcaceae bacterium]
MGDPEFQQPRRFTTTRWSLVRAAGQKQTIESRVALSTLCRLYWYPVYAFVRRRGAASEQALDSTQGFFTDLLERNDLASANPDRGSFRSWLLACVKHFLANEHDRQTALKRGGGLPTLSIDAEDAEGRYRLEPSHELTPEKLYQRRWTLLLLEGVLATLKSTYVERGNEALFERLKGTLVGEADGPYAQIAKDLEMTEAAVKVAAHRFRKKYGELLRAAVAETVESPEEVEEEIRRLGDDL